MDDDPGRVDDRLDAGRVRRPRGAPRASAARSAGGAGASRPSPASRRRSSSTTSRAIAVRAAPSTSAVAGRRAARTASTLGGRARPAADRFDKSGPPGGNAWESNPPRHAERGVTGFEDRGTHRDPSAPAVDGSALGADGRRLVSSGDDDAEDVPAIRLTDLTDCGGCAAKLGADLLADALAGLGADAAASPDAR